MSCAHPLHTSCILNRAQSWIPTQMVCQPGVTERKCAILQCVRDLNEMNMACCSRRVISIARRPLIFYGFLVTLKCLPLNRYPGKVFYCIQQRAGWDDSHVWVSLGTSGSGVRGNIYSFWATRNQNIILVNIYLSKTVEYANYHEASHSFFLGFQSHLFTSMFLVDSNPLNIKCSLFNVLLS